MRARLLDARALAVGSILNGLLAYVFFVLATRSLGSRDAAPVALLWTYWSFAAAALTFPLQHWIARSVAARGGEGAVRAALPRVAVGIVAVSVVSGTISWLARDVLFGRSDATFPVLVAGVTLGSGFIGVVRGGLAARSQFKALATAVAGENLTRVAAALLLVALGDADPVGFGICLVVGSLIGLAWPRAIRFAADGTELETDSAAAFLGPAAGGQLIGQAVLVGGPVALAWAGGSPHEVTGLFSALAVFRAPYTLAIGMLGQLTPILTRLVTERREAGLEKVRRAILVGTAAGVCLAAAVGPVTGSSLLPAVFGSDVQLESGPATLVAVGSALALANLVLTVLLMAHGRTATIAASWGLALAAGAGGFAVATGGPLEETCWAFAIAEMAAWACMFLSELRSRAA